jgi:hypothetical protein
MTALNNQYCVLKIKHVVELSETEKNNLLELTGKGSANGRKRSWVYLTTTGRKAFKNHINELLKLIEGSTDT